MATIYDLKPAFQALLRPVCRLLASRGITANQVTIAAVLLSMAAGGLVLLLPTAHWPLVLFPLVLFLRMALNAIDGMLAREHGMKTRLGAVLNELGDVVADAALYLPLAVIPGVSGWLVVGVVLMAIIVEMTGVVAMQIGATRRYDGPIGKSDRAFWFGFLAFLMGSGIRPGLWADILLTLLLGLSAVTVVNRARKGLAETGGSVP